MLVSANKKISLKNLFCLTLSIIENLVVVILKIFKAKRSIFWVLTLVNLGLRLNWAI